MLTVAGHTDGYMHGINLRSEQTPEGERETMSFEVRRAKDCVELHISNRVFKGRSQGGRTTAKYMLHSYSPAAYRALLQVLQTVDEI